jgi:hypothetical protein
MTIIKRELHLLSGFYEGNTRLDLRKIISILRQRIEIPDQDNDFGSGF